MSVSEDAKKPQADGKFHPLRQSAPQAFEVLGEGAYRLIDAAIQEGIDALVADQSFEAAVRLKYALNLMQAARKFCKAPARERNEQQKITEALSVAMKSWTKCDKGPGWFQWVHPATDECPAPNEPKPAAKKRATRKKAAKKKTARKKGGSQ